MTPESATAAILSLLECELPESDRKLILKKLSGKTKLRLLSSHEVMETLNISRPTLREYVRQGKIKPIRYSSRKVRYDADEIEWFRCQGTWG